MFVFKYKSKLILYRSLSINMKSLSMMYVASTWIKIFEISNDILLKDLNSNFFILILVYFINLPLTFLEKKNDEADFDEKLFLRPPKSTSSKKLSFSYLSLLVVGFLLANYFNLESLNLPYLITSFVCFILLILAIKNKINLEGKVRERTVELYIEKGRADTLLENILPRYVIDELKESKQSSPRKFNKVSVLFTDFVDFTSISSSIKPYELVRELNDMFTEFDNIIENYNCDRIKTIGDAYMAVDGLNNENENSSENLILAAMDIVKYLKERNNKSILKWKVRIGISQGDVVAGIVGVKKYLFDVFGETVNIASRLESKSEPMRINVSSSIYYELRDKILFESRGMVEVKGLGKLKMHFVVGKKTNENEKIEL
jgi:class 3 adenylate cyclase